LPVGATVTIKMTQTSGLATSDLTGDGWFFSDGNWLHSTFDFTTDEQTFKTQNPFTSELRMTFAGTGAARVDFFECGSPSPTRTKNIAWGPAQP